MEQDQVQRYAQVLHGQGYIFWWFAYALYSSHAPVGGTLYFPMEDRINSGVGHITYML